MGIPLTEIIDEDNQSMREQAADNNLPYEQFTMRELITPQYALDEVGLAESDEVWENWVGQHSNEHEDRRELQPENREQLIAAVVEKAHEEDGRVRAVGSGHSHSNAPAPEGTYIELDPGGPEESNPAGLNSLLDDGGWLKTDDELAAIDGGGGPFHNPMSDGSTVMAPLDREHLFRLEAGITIRRLNRHVLREYGEEAYALPNMGSFDGQTIAGAVNTSTHGTGITLPAISDSVTSVEIATVPQSESGDPIVRMFRIEPTDGVTDREAFEADTGTHEMELIQDDDVFHSVVVGYGCMGVVYSYTMEVVDNYWLREEAELMAWSDLKQELGEDEESVRDFLRRDNTRHCQILVNTAAEQVPDNNLRLRQHEAHGVGQHEDHQDPVCLIKRHKVAGVPDRSNLTERNTAEIPEEPWVNATKDQRWPPERRAKPFQYLGQALLEYHPLDDYPGRAKQLHNNFFHPEFNKDPFVGGKHATVWYVALRRLRDEGDENTPEHYHPKPPLVPTPTTEIGVGVGDVAAAVDAMLEMVRSVTQGDQVPDDRDGSNGEGEDVFFPVPMGIRFTAGSEHFLSPEYDRDTAMVELPLPLPKEGQIVHPGLNPLHGDLILDHDDMRRWVVLPALTKVEQHFRENLSSLEPRPHMGKHNTVDATWLDANYEHFDADGDDVETGWLQAYWRFNAFGTFDNAFTDQLNIRGSGEFSQPLIGSVPTEDGETATPTEDGETPTPTDDGETPTPTDDGGTDVPDSPEATSTDVGVTNASEPGETTTGEGTGFGVVAGLAGLGAGAWLLDRTIDEGPPAPSDRPDAASGSAAVDGEAADDRSGDTGEGSSRTGPDGEV